MAGTAAQKTARDELLEALKEVGIKAFDTEVPLADREPYREEFDQLVAK